MTNSELDNVFEESTTETTKVGHEATKEVEQEVEQKGDDADVQETEQEQETEAVKPTVEDEDKGEKSIPVAALKSERQKRQAAESEREELKKKLAQYEVGSEEPQELDVDEKLFNERVNMSREMMMETKSDYAEMAQTFIDLAKNSPALLEDYRRSGNPAKFAYQKAKEHVEYQQFLKDKDSEDYKEFLKLKTEGKLSKQVEESPEEKRKKAALGVPKLNNLTSKSSNSVPKAKLSSWNEILPD